MFVSNFVCLFCNKKEATKSMFLQFVCNSSVNLNRGMLAPAGAPKLLLLKRKTINDLKNVAVLQSNMNVQR